MFLAETRLSEQAPRHPMATRMHWIIEKVARFSATRSRLSGKCGTGITKKIREGMTMASGKKSSSFALRKPFWLSLAVLLCNFPGRSQQPPADQTAKIAFADLQGTDASAGRQQNG